MDPLRALDEAGLGMGHLPEGKPVDGSETCSAVAFATRQDVPDAVPKASA